MSTDKFTSGPWTNYGATRTGSLLVGAQDAKGVITATATVHGDSDEDMLENARLIASAPELLAALRGLTDTLRRDGYPISTPEIRNARALLARLGEHE